MGEERIIRSLTAQTTRYAATRFSANNDKQPSVGDLATQELNEAKPVLDVALRPSGFRLDEAKYLILSSARNLFVITPKTWTFVQDAAFEKAFTAALKNLPPRFAILRQFIDTPTPNIVFTRDANSRPQ